MHAVRFTGKSNYDTLKAFAERHSGRLADCEQSFKNATAFATQFKDAFPGVRLDVCHSTRRACVTSRTPCSLSRARSRRQNSQTSAR